MDELMEFLRTEGVNERLLKAGGAYAALYHTQLSRQE